MATRRWVWWLAGVPALAALLIVVTAVLTTGSRRRDAPLQSIPPTTSPSVASLPDPCSLIPAEQVAALVGHQGPGVPESEISCRFGDEEGGLPILRIQVVASPGGLADLAEARELAVGAFGAGSVVDIPNLAKGAFAVTSPDVTLVRYLDMGHQTVIGLAGAGQGEEALTLALELARAAAPVP